MNRLLIDLHDRDSRGRRRQHDTTVTLVVTVQQHLDHRMVLADRLHSRVTKLPVGDTQDELVDEVRIAVERVLSHVSAQMKVKRYGTHNGLGPVDGVVDIREEVVVWHRAAGLVVDGEGPSAERMHVQSSKSLRGDGRRENGLYLREYNLYTLEAGKDLR
jgi:hypothetical protein